jgi:ABC transporter family protein
MRQRLGLARALIGDPALLILDEPTNGLDPRGRREMHDVLLGLAAEGVISPPPLIPSLASSSPISIFPEPRLSRLVDRRYRTGASKRRSR